MDKETLLHRKTDVEQRFKELTANKVTIDEELARLQGEHRLLVDLLKDAEESPIEKPKRLRKVTVTEDATS
jgi:hypothetical protein